MSDWEGNWCKYFTLLFYKHQFWKLNENLRSGPTTGCRVWPKAIVFCKDCFPGQQLCWNPLQTKRALTTDWFLLKVISPVSSDTSLQIHLVLRSSTAKLFNMWEKNQLSTGGAYLGCCVELASFSPLSILTCSHLQEQKLQGKAMTFFQCHKNKCRKVGTP